MDFNTTWLLTVQNQHYCQIRFTAATRIFIFILIQDESVLLISPSMKEISKIHVPGRSVPCLFLGGGKSLPRRYIEMICLSMGPQQIRPHMNSIDRFYCNGFWGGTDRWIIIRRTRACLRSYCQIHAQEGQHSDSLFKEIQESFSSFLPKSSKVYLFDLMPNRMWRSSAGSQSVINNVAVTI